MDEMVRQNQKIKRALKEFDSEIERLHRSRTEIEALHDIITKYDRRVALDRAAAVKFANALLDPTAPNTALLKEAHDYLEAIVNDLE